MLPLLGYKQVALIGGQIWCPYWGTNRLPLLGDRQDVLRLIGGQTGCPYWDKQVALIGGQIGCPYWGICGLPLLVPVSVTIFHCWLFQTVSITALSPCGRYLATACKNGLVLIWDLNVNKCVNRDYHEKKLTITALAWNPKGNHQVSFCDDQGNVGQMEGVVPDMQQVMVSNTVLKC